MGVHGGQAGRSGDPGSERYGCWKESFPHRLRKRRAGKSVLLVTAEGTRPTQRERRDALLPYAAPCLAFLTALGHWHLDILALDGLVQRFKKRRQVDRHDRGLGELAPEVVK